MTEISRRLDRLPFSRFHRKLLVIGGAGYSFDAIDSACLAFILPVLKEMWGLTSGDVGFLASSTYIGYLFGALFAGIVGDMVGRKTVMIASLAIYTLSSLACVAANDPWTFFFFRLISGFGMGAEGTIIAPYLAEFVGKQYRGRFTGSLLGFYSFGYFAAALLGYLLIAQAHISYKVLLVITALPVLMVLWWRRALPESPRWLEIQGRVSEAQAIVANVEAGAIKDGHVLADLPMSEETPQAATRLSLWNSLAMLWSPDFAKRTAVSWLIWVTIAFSYYAFFSWIPTLLVQHGMSLSKSFAFSLAIYGAQVPGYYSAAFLNDLVGRRGNIGAYMILSAICSGALAFSSSDLEIIIGAIGLSIFMNGTFAGLYAYTSEIFPTVIRATGLGTSSAVGRFGAIAAPIVVGTLYPIAGFPGVFGTTFAVLMVGAIVILIFGLETKGRSLEEIAG